MAISTIDGLLRGRELTDARSGIACRLRILLVAGAIFGAVMGAFNGVNSPRLLQMAYSAIKVPLLLSAAFFLSLPSFFVFNALAGLREDFFSAAAAVAGAQAVLTIVLLSVAPLTGLWYFSDSNYQDAILFNGVMFGVASVAAQIALRRSYRALILRNRRHRAMLWVWLIVYVFVVIQMAWVLRPFVGAPGLPTRFFRADAFSNAYVYIARLVGSAIAR